MTKPKKEKAPVKNTLGFSNEELKKLPKAPGIRIMTLLQQILIIYNNPNLFGFKQNGKRFVWISYRILLEKFRGMDYSYRTLQRDLHKLQNFGFIERSEMLHESKKRIFFHVTELTEKICTYKVQK